MICLSLLSLLIILLWGVVGYLHIKKERRLEWQREFIRNIAREK